MPQRAETLLNNVAAPSEELATALARVRLLRKRRDTAILKAVGAGLPLRRIGAAANISSAAVSQLVQRHRRNEQ